MMVRELRAEGQELRAKATYLIGPRGPEYRYDHQSQTIRWYCYDGLGSVLAEVDPLGNLTASRKYDVYGLVRWSNGSSTSKHKYVGSLGHTSDDETALIYMRARWMDPSLGRFISEDPARDGANWFEYCRGNPVNAVDPDGRTSEEAGFWFAISGLMSVVTSMLLGGVYRFGLGVLEWTKATSKFLESEAAFESGNSFGGAALKAEALDLMGRARASMLRGGLMVALGVALVVTVVYGMFVSLVDHPEWD
jgi:RHS repeat-associated protein